MKKTQISLDELVESIKQVNTKYFTVTSNKLKPKQRATLKWDIDLPKNLTDKLYLAQGDGTLIKINRVDSKLIKPLATSKYRLLLVDDRMRKAIATQLVEVEPENCLEFIVPEDEIKRKFTTKIDEIIARNPKLSRRKSDVIEVEQTGIQLKLYLKAAVDNWADPDVNIKANIVLWAEDGKIKYLITEFTVDIDFPWYADLAAGAGGLPVWLYLVISTGNQKQSIKENITNGIEEMIDSIENQLNRQGYKLMSIRTEKDEVILNICSYN